MSTRVGHGFDAHRLADGRPFIVGGVRIEFPRGPLGHSDGDCLAHAIADAVLGACNLGELGGHFPDNDPKWKDADSIALLERCGELARSAGYEFVNIDATVVVELPKLAAHLHAMRERLAKALRIDLGSISVKAKTSEGMGYTGDGSGIAAYAVAAVERISFGGRPCVPLSLKNPA